MTLVDTNVLLDVLVESSIHGDESEGRLAAALRAGTVFINDVVAAELAAAFDEEAALWETLSEVNVVLQPFPRQAIHPAGRAFVSYRKAGGRRQRILADFLIGAHALSTGALLLTRDRGFYRKHFASLRLAP
jgi:predicted nucleic acid-binding protein